jgi:hypothetical protein
MTLKWHTRESSSDYPPAEGWYRVMISGDSESVDGHLIYSYPDYETWAHFAPASPASPEPFPGGYRGTFTGWRDEDDSTIFAYCGPILIPPYEAS